MWYNIFVAWLLRSPVHRFLSHNMMLITVQGRTTGRRMTTPVSYYRFGDELWIISNRDRTWWRNLRESAPVSLQYRGKEVNTVARAVLDQNEVGEMLAVLLSRHPGMGNYIDVRMINGKAHPDDIQSQSKERLFVRVKFNQPAV